MKKSQTDKQIQKCLEDGDALLKDINALKKNVNLVYRKTENYKKKYPSLWEKS